MAYAAVKSLMHTICRFLKSCDDIQIVQNSSQEMIKLLEGEALSLAEVLQGLEKNTKRFSSKRLNIVLDAQIRDAVFKLEDVVEFHLLDQFVSQSQNYIRQHPLVFCLDIEELKQEIDLLIETVNKLKAEYIYELSSNNLPNQEEEEEQEDDDDAEEEDDAIVKTDEPPILIGSDKLFMGIKDQILRHSYFRTSFIYGMAGIGKTTLARKVFEDPSISSHFESRAWVTVGPQYQLEEVLRDILKQLAPNTTIRDDKIIILLEGDYQETLDCWNEYLKERKCLLVLDDVWDLWDEGIARSGCLSIFNNDGNRVLVTSRQYTGLINTWNMPFMDKKESWDLLWAKVFGKDSSSSSCTPQLERAGKKIVENCEGLPLTIVKVANILSRLEKTPELWNKVAANKQHPVYKEAYAKMHKVLLPSYYNLPQYLRISFLYMGVFPQNYEILCSKLHMLWKAEGFIQLEEDSHSVDQQHFHKLLYDQVLIAHSATTLWNLDSKTVGLHSSFWYVCKKEAGKSKFFHSFTTLDDCSPQGIETQRRLCIYNPVLFAIKDAFDKMASVSAARSLLCTGVYHPYPVPLCFGLRLLRVLYALTIHFYEFPMEALELIHLTYFALTCDGDLPACISKLWNLMYLIVDRRLSIRSSDGAPSYLPVEIWDMKSLEHLQVMGSDLPEPHAVLLKLSKLLGVSPHSCTKRILESIPNLTKLGIRIELSPDEDAVHQPLGCLDHMSELRSFKCVVVNPRFTFEAAAPPPIPLPLFPESLVKLTLSGLGYPWEEMSKISSSLPNLRALKLLSYAFRGPKWDIQNKEFPSLEGLVIEETNLVQWTIEDYYCIKKLTHLRIKHCYKLKEIPMYLSEELYKIEVVDCNPLVVRSANKIKEVGTKHSLVNLNVHSSWDDRN